MLALNTYITTNKNGILYTNSEIMDSITMTDTTKIDTAKPFSLGCFHLWRTTQYEADSIVKNDECSRYANTTLWELTKDSPIKTKTVYIFNSVTKGCLYAVDKTSNEVKIDNECNGNAYLWEIPYSGKCGFGFEYCGDGCQSKYGECLYELPDPNPQFPEDDPSETYCGPQYGNKKCSFGDCCSKDGKCGFGHQYCGKGCQPEFGGCL